MRRESCTIYLVVIFLCLKFGLMLLLMPSELIKQHFDVQYGIEVLFLGLLNVSLIISDDKSNVAYHNVTCPKFVVTTVRTKRLSQMFDQSR